MIISIALALIALEIKDLEEWHDFEIASAGRVQVSELVNPFLSCVPQESQPFPTLWPQSLTDSIFRPKELRDLMGCHSQKCLFNFLPAEVAELEKASSENERKRLYRRFYEDRAAGRTGLDPRKERNFIRKAEGWGACSSQELEDLLKRRPLQDRGYRLSHVHYDERMRPTTRLLQSATYRVGDTECYAEALLFADHYDVDRVEVWSRNKRTKELRLEVRHRIDLLNTWVRRLNKNAFRRELRELVENQVKAAKACIENTKKK